MLTNSSCLNVCFFSSEYCSSSFRSLRKIHSICSTHHWCNISSSNSKAMRFAIFLFSGISLCNPVWVALCDCWFSSIHSIVIQFYQIILLLQKSFRYQNIKFFSFYIESQWSNQQILFRLLPLGNATPPSYFHPQTSFKL